MAGRISFRLMEVGVPFAYFQMEEYNIDVVEAPEEVARKIEELSKKD